MPHLISQINILDAWKEAVIFLLKNERHFSNIILTISRPDVFDEQWLQKYDPRKIKNKIKSIRDVTNTIFPQKLKLRASSRQEFYDRYKIVHARRKSPGILGTYFLRLISFGEKNINQLERVITKINTWERKNYNAAFVFHLSSPETDGPRKLGGPCWHYGELSIRDGKIDFSVVYRSRDYFGKTLGNFIGLSRLLSFICEETGMEPGIMTCHSIWAFLDSTKKQAEEILRGI
jgi:thymidylate synthase